MKKHLTIFALLLHSLVSHAGDLISGIQYGDSSDEVMAKLEKSDLVNSNLDKSMFARVGMNGSFETTNTLKGMKFKLYFDWQDSGSTRKLSQMTFRSNPTSLKGNKPNLLSAWVYAQNILTAKFGNPTNSGEYPKTSKLPDGGIIYSHEWKTRQGYVYLGLGKEEGKINLSINFCKSKLSEQ